MTALEANSFHQEASEGEKKDIPKAPFFTTISHNFFETFRKALLKLPLGVRAKIVRFMFTLPVRPGRQMMYLATHPYGYQWNSIVRVKKEGWSGNWIALGIRKLGLDWVEQTAASADLVIMYIHGGAFRIGHSLMYMDSFNYILDRLGETHGLKARIFSVEYNMVPQHHWPRPREDCEDAYRYLIQDLNIHPSKVILAGDSAGGNIAATLLLNIRDHLRFKAESSFNSLSRLPLPMPAGGLLISPWVTLESNSPTYASNAATDCLPRGLLSRPSWYFANDFRAMDPEEQAVLLRDPFVSPVYGNFEGVCPVMVTLGGLEMFQHDVEAFIARLQKDGVHVDVLMRPDSPHVWVIAPPLAPTVAVWEEGARQLADWCASRVL